LHKDISGKIAEDFLAILPADKNEESEKPQNGIPRIAVVGNIEDDYHSIGRRMVATFLRLDGWFVIDIGNDVLSESFVDHALESRATVIGVSAMMLSNALNISKVRDEINRRGLQQKLSLAVGGAIFAMRPELAREVGADGTAPNALLCPNLFNNLHMRANL